MQFSYRGQPLGGGTPGLGEIGYVVALLQIIGFAAGGWCVYSYLANQLYCDKCSRYFSFKGKRQQYYSDKDKALVQYENIKNKFAESKYQEAINLIPKKNDMKKDDCLSLDIEIKYCKKCLRHYISTFISKKDNKGYWETINDTIMGYLTDNELKI